MTLRQALRIAPPSAGRRLAALGLALMVLAVLAVLAACQVGDDHVDGRGTEAENEIQGMLVDAFGRPVAGARIKAYPGDLARQSPASAQDSGVTDNEGRYTLEHLTPGTYNLVGERQDAALSVYIPGIDYVDGPAIDIGEDTLLAPGSLEGRVLQGNAGKAGVLVYAPGTSFLAVTDAAGAFRFQALPEGVYRIRYQVSGFQVAADSNIDVRAGLLTRLADKILATDTAAPPPAPARVGASFDTLNSRVTLVWDSVDLADRAGYRVYRDDGTLSLPIAVSGLIAGTRFTDSTLGSLAGANAPPEVGYRVRTVDRDMNESDGFSPVVRVRIVPRSRVTTRLLLADLSSRFGFIGLGKPAMFRLEFENPTRRIRKVAWTVDSLPRRETGFDGLAGSDSLTASWANEGLHTVQAEATDEAGTVWTASVSVTSVRDAPEALAGADMSVSLGDTVRLRPAASDVLGEIVAWEWDLGAGGAFRQAPSGVLDFQAPARPIDAYPCILRVTDEDGLQGLDTVIVRILADVPTARITVPRLEAFTGDTLVLSSSASRDSMGRIVRVDWDVGATGIFRPGTGDAIEVTATQVQSLPCVLRVTDDDGQTDTARVLLRFVPRDRWILAGADSVLGGFDKFHAWVHSGRLSLFVRYWNRFPEAGFLTTRDLRQWDTLPVPTPIYPNLPPIALGGRIWMIDNEPGVLWYSDDGVTWTSMESESYPRQLRNVVVSEHDGKIWLLGILDSAQTRRSEVWNSSDGRTWSRITDKPEYGFRVVIAAASWKGRLWVYGNAWSTTPADQDLWSSADGLAWRREAGGIFPGIRQSADLFVHRDELWMMSTHRDLGTFWGEVRRSGDGRTWTEVPGETPSFSDYGTARALVFNGRVWLLSSAENASREYEWQVWQAPD